MYKTLYKEIVDKARSENRTRGGDTYYERHHIVPDFLYKNRKRKGPVGHLDGDPNSKENIVLLTFCEHLMCHYYLYEIYKGTRYEYSAGSSLQFFFTKAVGNHQRQINLTEVDRNFLSEMEFLRKIGNESISKARKGNMPVVDAVTRESVGSVPVNHPKVLSGEWVHHSKGVPSPVKPENRQSQRGSENNNFKEMTDDRRKRVFQCVIRSECEGYIKKVILESEIKREFLEFKKISLVWLTNNFGSILNLVNLVNIECGTSLKYEPYHRTETEKRKISTAISDKVWVTNGEVNRYFYSEEAAEFLINNIGWIRGKMVKRINHD